VPHSFATASLGLQPYHLRLSVSGEANGHAFATELTTTSFAVVAPTPPILSLLEPLPGLACDAVEVRVRATDALSGIDRVTLNVDDGPDITLQPLGNDLFGTTLDFGTGEAGLHHLAIVAVDGEANSSPPSGVDIDVDPDPPEITTNAPAEGSCRAEAVTITFAATDDHLASVTATLNGLAFASGDTVSDEGSHELIIIAEDDCGHQAQSTRTFIIDTTAPEITVDGVAEGETHVLGMSVTWSATDGNLSTSKALLDGEPVASTFRVDLTGDHLLTITAEDCAGNSAEEQISFHVVAPEQSMSADLAVNPAQVQPPQPLQVTGTLDSLVATPLPGIEVTLELIDPASGLIIDSSSTI
ncbi:MAG: hypothetical protein GY838_15730, partial [bacterium]|nr:hypothetical protein [bacterium]